MASPSLWYWNRVQNGNLNKHGLWESVIGALESTCVGKIQRMHRSHLCLETVYSVPAIGHKTFLPAVVQADDEEAAADLDNVPPSDKTRIKQNPSQFMHWDGRFFDVNCVHVVTADHVLCAKPLGPRTAPTPALGKHVAEFTKNLKYSDCRHKRHHRGHCQIVRDDGRVLSHLRCVGWSPSCEADFLEIDLAYPRCVTHLGTTGGFPSTKSFPYRELEERHYDAAARHRRSHSHNRFAPYIRVMDEHRVAALCWVTAYEVHYRHAITNKWTFLCATSANSDAFTEHLLDLRPYYTAATGLFTRGLRIRPLECHNGAWMRVSVYGRNDVDQQPIVAAAPAAAVPTIIEYAVTHGAAAQSARRYVRDGVQCLGDKRWNREKNHKAIKRSGYRRDIDEGQQEWWWDCDRFDSDGEDYYYDDEGQPEWWWWDCDGFVSDGEDYYCDDEQAAK